MLQTGFRKFQNIPEGFQIYQNISENAPKKVQVLTQYFPSDPQSQQAQNEAR